MKKLTTKKEELRREKKRNFIITTLLAIILLMSIGGYSFIGKNSSSNTENSIIYNGLNFYNSNDYWISNKNKFRIVLKNNPKELENIIIPDSIKKIENYYGRPLYIYSQDLNAKQEIFNNLNPENNIVQRIQETCIKEEACEKDLPIKDCSNNIIILKKSKNPKIYQQENCVYIEGNSTELTKMSDKFILYLIGIN